MARIDGYERLVRFYGSAFGELPNRDEFSQAVREALTEDDVRILFLIPPRGIKIERLERRAARAGISQEQLHATIGRLRPEGFLASYVRPEPARPAWARRLHLPSLRGPTGPIVSRQSVLVLTEIQSRKPEDDAMRRAAVHWMNAMIEDAGRSVPNKTPYKRVLAVEETLAPGAGRQRIQIGESVPDRSAALTLDTLSEMLKKEDIIAVADCYCRSTKRAIGEGCNHPLRTCFYFGEIALLQLSSGRAERLDYDEAMQILRTCEDAGLVHTVDNNGDRLGVMCNCCPCSCPVIRSWRLGGTNVLAPSRFIAAHDRTTCTHCDACIEICPMDAIEPGASGLAIDSARCIGCGLCASHCPSGSMRMVPREAAPPMASDEPAMTRRIAAEVVWGLLKGRVSAMLGRGDGQRS
ncbi:MAG: 4Fe-4S binding protein [Actinobacteria bacterium]|nr:4Fe-4S binding protein [Actinomycetota bacterium]